MGRTLKRVPLDFDWPSKLIWKGFRNPYAPTPCEPCHESGYNPETKKLSDDWYDFSSTGRRWCDALTQEEVDILVEAGRLKPSSDDENDVAPITAKEVNDANHTPGTSNLAHDAVNKYIVVEARAKRLGVFGHCKVCAGDGHYWCDPKYEALYQEWIPINPPEGPGFQLWETTSEGSPVSPVFESLEELCVWCADNATTFGYFTATKDEWASMLYKDFIHHTSSGIPHL